MSLFKKAVNQAMLKLAEDPRAVFVGQSVRYDGAAVYDSLDGVPMDQRIEMPVVEDFQLGFCTGLALMSKLPVCIFPRMDFMLLCMNQLVNHLDKAPLFGWAPRVIIRTTVGKRTPLDAGPQHTQNYARAFSQMLQNVVVAEVGTVEQVRGAYKFASLTTRSTLIVENER